MQALATNSENEIGFMLKLTLLINHSFLINYNIANIGNNASAMLLDFMEKIVEIQRCQKRVFKWTTNVKNLSKIASKIVSRLELVFPVFKKGFEILKS